MMAVHRLCFATFVAVAAASFESQQQRPLVAPPWFSPPIGLDFDSQSGPIDFQLRHIFHHGTHKHPELHRRLDIDDTTVLPFSDGLGYPQSRPKYRAKPRSIPMQRLVNRPSSETYHTRNSEALQHTNAWTEEKVSAPDVTDKETILSFARMAWNAYTEVPNTGDWVDVGKGFNYTEHFGWESDGLRGHIFADTKNQTVVISMKGTSLPFIDPVGTISNDKVNDNLLFSCCCGQGGRWLWHQVCDCQTEAKVCNSTCLRKEMRQKTRYYYAAQELYFNVTKIYPDADIWLVGHSLGGSVASLIGLFVGQPVVTFEAPAEATAALRLGLPQPDIQLGAQGHKRATTGGYHFGHTADDIFMGNCNAWNSICTLGGYAMETKCHTGHVCVYDTVKDLKWSPNARSNHGIALVLKDVIGAYDELPDCKVQSDCTDCDEWKFNSS